VARACCAPRLARRSRSGLKTHRSSRFAQPRRSALDRPAGGGLSDTGERLSPGDGERILRLVAHHVGAEFIPIHLGYRPNCLRPRALRGIAAAGGGGAGLCDPKARGRRIYPRRLCRRRHHEREAGRNIARGCRGPTKHPCRGRHLYRQDHAHQRIVGGGRKSADRVVLIEDTRELQCKAPNLVALRTKDGVASLSDLVAPRYGSGRIASHR